MSILAIAFLLDLILGDPRWLPHLIVFYGKLINAGEILLNKSRHLFLKGMGLTILWVGLAYLVPMGILRILDFYEFYIISNIFSVMMLFYCLANRTLIQEGRAVFRALEKRGIEAARKRLAWIVGRDTSRLNPQKIRMATFETMSENLSDGVIAPMLYYVWLGIPGAMAYKMINTLDSMIGYRNKKFENFGKFAAKLDDAANFIPSRLTALLMLLVTFKLGGIPFVIQQGKKHSSPNAGYPEAALAYILNCRFGGPSYYNGILLNKPYIGVNDRILQQQEIVLVVAVNYRVSIMWVIFSLMLFYWV